MRIPELIKDYYRYLKIIYKYNRNPFNILDIFRKNSGIRVLDALKIYPETIVDIGANKGEWIDNYHKYLKSNTKYFLIEPNEDYYAFLVHKYNNYDNIYLYNIAISSENGIKSFNYSNSADFSSLEKLNNKSDLFKKDVQYFKSENIECITLDYFYNEIIQIKKIDLLKIDVQGHELNVLSGARSVLSKVKYILIEWNIHNIYLTDSTFINVHLTLVKNNFSLLHLFNQYVENNNLIYTDALYINNKVLTEMNKI